MDGQVDVSWLRAGMEAEIEFEVFGSPFTVKGEIRESIEGPMSLLIGNSTITYHDGSVSSKLVRVITPLAAVGVPADQERNEQ